MAGELGPSGSRSHRPGSRGALLATLPGSGMSGACCSSPCCWQARSEPSQSATASGCKSSDAKVLLGAVQPHGFSLSTLQEEGEQGRWGQSMDTDTWVLATELGPTTLGDSSSRNLPFPRQAAHPGSMGGCLCLAPEASPGEESPSPALPPRQAGQGRQAAREGLLPTLELQVQRELQSGGLQATTGSVSSPHLPPFLSIPLSFPPRLHQATQVVYQPRGPEGS